MLFINYFIYLSLTNSKNIIVIQKNIQKLNQNCFKIKIKEIGKNKFLK